MTNKLNRLPEDVLAQLLEAYEVVHAKHRLSWADPSFKTMWDTYHKWNLGERQNWACNSCARHVYQRVGWLIERLNQTDNE